ncbi:hypothetical protein GZL_00114 [Streptomyces sp. 769]|nr:hypothetical protein GZL_00114 [Streptomyces sp. 769]
MRRPRLCRLAVAHRTLPLFGRLGGLVRRRVLLPPWSGRNLADILNEQAEHLLLADEQAGEWPAARFLERAGLLRELACTVHGAAGGPFRWAARPGVLLRPCCAATSRPPRPPHPPKRAAPACHLGRRRSRGTESPPTDAG